MQVNDFMWEASHIRLPNITDLGHLHTTWQSWCLRPYSTELYRSFPTYISSIRFIPRHQQIRQIHSVLDPLFPISFLYRMIRRIKACCNHNSLCVLQSPHLELRMADFMSRDSGTSISDDWEPLLLPDMGSRKRKDRAPDLREFPLPLEPREPSVARL